MTKDEMDVVTTVERMTAAFQSGAIDDVMKLYAPGAGVAFEPGVTVADPAVMRARFAQWAALAPKFEYGGHDVMVSEDVALHVAPWTMRGTGPDGSAVMQTGLSVAVLRRQRDGAWLIAIDNPHGQRLLDGAAVR